MQERKSVHKVLLVDDDADDRKYFVEALREIDASIECTTAKDGEQCLAILANPASILPDFIFLDLRMPKVNGKECLLKIKDTELLKHIPVIIYTASKEIEQSEEMQGLGAVRFISKPNEPEEIFYVLSLLLEEWWDVNIRRNNNR